MPTVTAPSREEWMKYEKSPVTKQQELLERFQDEFVHVPITGSDSIREGDHLVVGRKKYDHHMLVTERNGDQVKIIEYTGPALGISPSAKSVSSKDLTVMGKIVEQCYSLKYLVDHKMQKVIWPDKSVWQYSVKERIQRARSRKGETYYDLLKNNCEHFVTWSICGLNVSLQVKSLYITLREVLYSLFAGLYDWGRNKAVEEGCPLLLKIAANVCDEVAGWISENITENIAYCSDKAVGWICEKFSASMASGSTYPGVADGICKQVLGFISLPFEKGAYYVDKLADWIAENPKFAGFALAFLIEAAVAYYEIKKASKYCKTKEEYNVKLVCIIAKALGRWGLGTLGSLLGTAGGPVASLIGGAAGAGFGHFVGFIIGWCYEHRSYLDG